MINIDDVSKEFELIKSAKPGISNYSDVFMEIEAEKEKLMAKKHFFSVLSIANQIENIIKTTNVASKDIECVSFSEYEYSNDNWCLNATIESSENGDSEKVAKMEMELNEVMHILGDPKFYFFSDAASDEIDDNEFFEISNNTEDMAESFIKKAMNADLYEIYEKLKFKNELENNLNSKPDFKPKKAKM